MESNLLNKVYTVINGFIHPNSLKLFHANSNKSKDPRICPVTGLDISMQPKNSKFISATGVQWYFTHKKLTFNELLTPYLTEHWKDQPIERQFEEIAHNIRNKDSNKRHSTRRAINKMLDEKDFLFDPIQLIDKTKLKEAGLGDMGG